MNEVDRWKNRRKMAWISMLAGIGFPLLLLVTESPQLGAIAGPFYIFIGAVVGAYIGFAAWDDKNVMEHKDHSPHSRGRIYDRGFDSRVDDCEVQRR
jgi:hypothetical protein